MTKHLLMFALFAEAFVLAPVAGQAALPITTTTTTTAAPTTTTSTTTTLPSMGKVFLCHRGRRTLSVSVNAVPDHLAHGDTFGVCRPGTTTTTTAAPTTTTTAAPTTTTAAPTTTTSTSTTTTTTTTSTTTTTLVAPEATIVFVTSSTHQGDLGGLTEADQICDQLASGAGLPGTYSAWLSDDSEDAFDRVNPNGPYVRPDGVEISDNDLFILLSFLQESISVTETLGTYEGDVWTGTNASGTNSFVNCDNWTTNDGVANGSSGSSTSMSSAWTDNGQIPDCDVFLPFYCFENP